MLKVLLKKQMAEVFRSYFYNRKTNKARSKANSIVLFILFGFLMVGVLGGTFTFIALGVCLDARWNGLAVFCHDERNRSHSRHLRQRFQYLFGTVFAKG